MISLCDANHETLMFLALEGSESIADLVIEELDRRHEGRPIQTLMENIPRLDKLAALNEMEEEHAVLIFDPGDYLQTPANRFGIAPYAMAGRATAVDCTNFTVGRVRLTEDMCYRVEALVAEGYHLGSDDGGITYYIRQPARRSTGMTSMWTR